MTRRDAILFLSKRYDKLVVEYPRVAEIPRDLYIRRNMRAAMALTAEGIKGCA